MVQTWLVNIGELPGISAEYKEADGTLVIELKQDDQGFYWETEAVMDERLPTADAAIDNAVEFYTTRH